MKFSEFLKEASVLGQGMSKQAKAADVEQSDREYIAQRQQREKNYQAAQTEMTRDKLSGVALEKKLKEVAQKYKLKPSQVEKLRGECSVKESKEELTEALKSKKTLFSVLDEFFKTTEYSKNQLKAKGINDETYGKDSRIYISAGPKRRQLESFLKNKGFKVHTDYYPGSDIVEVSVSYFKGNQWDK
jgi:poly-D-alanine transfer protein DltD